MKTLFTFCFLLSAFGSFAQTFPSQNVTLLSNWFDTAVVAEPTYGIKYAGVFGWADTSNGREYAIIGSTAGNYFIEVTNPATPVVRDYVAGRRSGCIWREIHTYKNYVYLVSDDSGLPNSLQIVDMSYLPDSVHVVHDSTNIMSRCHTIYVDGNKLYGGSPKGPFGQASMGVFSLNFPDHPFLLRRLEEDFPGIAGTHDMFVRNDTVYASLGNAGFYIYKFDSIQNKFLALGSLTSYPYQGYNHSSSLTDNGNISIMCDEVPAGLQVKAVDVSDLANISVPSTFTSNAGATPHNPYVVGNDYAMIAYYQDGLQIFDISNPTNIVRTGYLDTDTLHGVNDNYSTQAYHGSWGAYPYLPSGNILVSDMQNGLFVAGHTYRHACFLEGTVTDSASGASLDSVSVEILSTTASVLSNISGMYKTGFADSTSYNIRFSKSGYNTKIIPGVNLNYGAITTLNTELSTAPAGIVNSNKNKISIDVFPNPFSSNLNISVPGEVKNLNYELLDFTGKIISAGKINNSFCRLNTQQLPSGIYMLKISGESFNEEKKIVKE